MFVILPFEKEFYKNFGMDVTYIGHPLAVEINQLPRPKNISNDNIALLPGSRKHEVEKLLPVMVEVAARLPNEKFIIAAVSHLSFDLYKNLVGNVTNITLETDAMRNVLQKCKAAIVTSGTATLETALMGVPEVVVYKGSPVSYQIAKRLIKVPYISLVNLIADKELVPELIQAACNADTILDHLQHIMEPNHAAEMKSGFDQMKSLLVAGGGAATAAIEIISDLQSITTKE